MRRNVELKARDAAPPATLERAFAAGVVEAGTLRQRDTYFVVASGRLKLREEEGRPAALIAYSRADEAAGRPSDYDLVEIGDADGVREALGRALGIRGVVEKSRRLFLWEETVRLHLDQVRDLGSFVEIEAVAAHGSDLARERDQVERLRGLLGIPRADLVPVGYADLLLR